MILAGVSRAIVVPTYLSDLDMVAITANTYQALSTTSLILLFATLVGSGALIVGAMVRGKRAAIVRSRTVFQVS
jgi:hypothetical protein